MVFAAPAMPYRFFASLSHCMQLPGFFSLFLLCFTCPCALSPRFAQLPQPPYFRWATLLLPQVLPRCGMVNLLDIFNIFDNFVENNRHEDEEADYLPGTYEAFAANG